MYVIPRLPYCYLLTRDFFPCRLDCKSVISLSLVLGWQFYEKSSQKSSPIGHCLCWRPSVVPRCFGTKSRCLWMTHRAFQVLPWAQLTYINRYFCWMEGLVFHVGLANAYPLHKSRSDSDFVGGLLSSLKYNVQPFLLPLLYTAQPELIFSYWFWIMIFHILLQFHKIVAISGSLEQCQAWNWYSIIVCWIKEIMDEQSQKNDEKVKF